MLEHGGGRCCRGRVEVGERILIYSGLSWVALVVLAVSRHFDENRTATL
jgi:hypothetical protein